MLIDHDMKVDENGECGFTLISNFDPDLDGFVFELEAARAARSLEVPSAPQRTQKCSD